MKVLVLALALVVSRSAHADVPSVPAPAPLNALDPEAPGTSTTASERHWYGWQILAADAVAGATAIVAVKTQLARWPKLP